MRRTTRTSWSGPTGTIWFINLTAQAAGETPLTYADYPGSPVPHAPQQAGLVVDAGPHARWALWGPLFWCAATAASIPKRSITSSPMPSATANCSKVAVGRGRVSPPAGGIFVLGGRGLVLFIVLMIYQQTVLYGALLKSAQARGVWSLITTFFTTLWILFDWGTSTAFVKFFAAAARG